MQTQSEINPHWKSTDLTIVSDVDIQLVDSMGDDSSIIRAMLVSTKGAESLDVTATTGRINYLIKNSHLSPFEHVTATFLVDCPLFVAREWHRHRTQSFNETSGRYRELEPRFYIPRDSRPLQQTGKVGHYQFSQGTDEQISDVRASLFHVYDYAYKRYYDLLRWGIAKEVARMCLPVGLMTQFYATANLRNWLNFLALRTDEHAQYEIRIAADKIESLLAKVAPMTMSAWREHGRKSL